MVTMANAGSIEKCFKVGAPVFVLMKGEMVRGLYAGCSHGVESMIVTYPNTLFKMHFPVSLSMGFMKPDHNPSFPPVPKRPTPVPVPPDPVPPRVDLSESLMSAAIEFFLSRAVNATTEAKLNEKIAARSHARTSVH